MWPNGAIANPNADACKPSAATVRPTREMLKVSMTDVKMT
jgi:hypothetical protein